ncbi:MAG TPA: cellobiose phosphorylase, partial [Roseiarcus sp.]|nr:cellobiose phosphorylase [Roseiarcus sp.]
MSDPTPARFVTPRQDDLGLRRIANQTGLSISLLPGGAIFAIEHARDDRRVMINQVLGSPVGGGMGRLLLRIGGAAPTIAPVIGAEVRGRVGAAEDRFAWEGERAGARHRASLWLHPLSNLWLWRLEVHNRSRKDLPCDAVLVQDLGLGDPNFVMNNEAYASQYIDCHVARHRRANYVVMSRQNLSQGGAHPWTVHGCLDGAVAFATDYRQLMGPTYRDADQFEIPFGRDLPAKRLQYETACAALQSEARVLAPGASASWTFFGRFEPDHPAASSDADLTILGDIERAAKHWTPRKVALAAVARSLVQEAPPAVADTLDEKTIKARYRRRSHVERADGELLSFFVADRSHNRHVVLRAKERRLARRHGALLRSGGDLLPSEAALCATCWMHGVFGAQLTIGNTSFHQLFSVSRDPYNIIRSSGLRICVEIDGRWKLLSVPSAFEIGLADCRWIYQFGKRCITVSAVVSGDEPAMQWRVVATGGRCRFLAFGHIVLGEREFSQAAPIEIDAPRKRFAFRPDPADKWGRAYPHAVYHLVASAPKSIEAIGGDELLYADGRRRSNAVAAIRTRPTNEFVFAATGSLTDPNLANALAKKYSAPIDLSATLARGARAWRKITRGVHITGGGAGGRAADTFFPWLCHDAMTHLTAPRGLEQYMGGAWGTRDVCQGPLELLLTLEHDEPAKAVLRVIFAQQYEKEG